VTQSKATPPIVVRLQSQFAELSPALARVAKHVINYPNETTGLSIEALSRVTERLASCGWFTTWASRVSECSS
jgi:hypothetical protein